MTNLYDALPYPDRPFRQTHPDRLASMGILHGMCPQDPSTARVLDVGCGSALNIIAMATAYPRARFVGFDLALGAVERARSRIAALGLTNIRIEHLDLMQFPADAGEFDFIIAHGFYSWVPGPVREALLALMNRHANANAICYLSFNARPGSTLRLAWRDAAGYHARGIEDAVTRAKASVDMLEMMAEASTAVPGAWRDVVDEMAALVREKGIHWVGHDDFGPVFEPFHFHEVVEAASRHGMQFLSEACHFDGQPFELGETARNVLASLEIANPVLREQYFDFLELRRFRQILLCRNGVALQRPIDIDGVRRLSFSSSADECGVTPDGQVVEFNPLTGIRSKVSAMGQRIIGHLRAAWPCSLRFEEILPDETDRSEVARRLERLWACALLEAHAVPQRCGPATAPDPVVWKLARLEADEGGPVTTRIHSQCDPDHATRNLIRDLSGRHSRETLAAKHPDLDARLAWLARMGLLEPPGQRVSAE